MLVKMENIFYEFGQWNLTPESQKELDNLVKLLNDNPNITIELSAHTDSVGTAESNMELSQKRANAAVEYLIGKGIAKDRLVPKGYGESQPVAVIASLPADYQVVCNQINRRTEFRVLRTTYNLF